MELKEQLTSVPGILRPFKAFLKASGLSDGDQIAYYGCPGTCTPFVELLGFATRDLPVEQVFVPYADESKAKILKMVPDVGMQAGVAPAVLNPRVIVLMGGLSMQGVPVTKEEVKKAVQSHDATAIIGVCFMNMFDRAGWLKDFDFDLLIDATIEPVKVWG
jgi:hypothetical protein